MATFFGGQAGKAESAIKSRKDRLDSAIEQDSGASDNSQPAPQESQKSKEKESARPPMSRKWYE